MCACFTSNPSAVVRPMERGRNGAPLPTDTTDTGVPPDRIYTHDDLVPNHYPFLANSLCVGPSRRPPYRIFGHRSHRFSGQKLVLADLSAIQRNRAPNHHRRTTTTTTTPSPYQTEFLVCKSTLCARITMTRMHSARTIAS